MTVVLGHVIFLRDPPTPVLMSSLALFQEEAGLGGESPLLGERHSHGRR